jgi:predicted MFS family arabinose efflux permease
MVLGIALEIMMVQWTVTLARRIPPDRLARVSSYDVLGSVAAMPAGALVAGPLAASIGVPLTEYGAAALILVASLLALAPREVRSLRSDQAAGPEEGDGPGETPRSGRDSGQDAARVMAGS